jgi:phosphogluconate dehydratase
MTTHPVVAAVTARLAARSRGARAAYLAGLAAQRRPARRRAQLACGNLAHGFAACGAEDKARLAGEQTPNLGIVTAHNDMLSAHQPFATYPDQIKAAARALGATAQVAGGVPAMCDGVTQGQPGMELSLLSRDVIALSTCVALSHDMFDAALYLGVCDKIVPGLLIGALAYGHLPGVFVPAGPMPSGSTNDEKAAVRKRYAEGKATRQELLASESAAYHGPGTCTFYGTANSNQLLMECMGLHVPGGTFINPGTPLRAALTDDAVATALRLVAEGGPGIGEIIDERAIINGVVGLLASGGSTNHALHLVAIAAAAGLRLEWEDMDALSAVVPLLMRVYPNGSADINHFTAAGGPGALIGDLLGAGLLQDQVQTVAGPGLRRYAVEARLGPTGGVERVPAPEASLAPSVLRGSAAPFRPDGGMRRVVGPLGQAIFKSSAVAEDRLSITAPARVFDSQEALAAAFAAGALVGDLIAVVRFQGPRANGMPELHGLTPALSVLQDRGQRVALVTDGRMSGASGKVPAAIHLSPEGALGGGIARLQDGDLLHLDALSGRLDVLVPAEEWAARPLAPAPASALGYGRPLFGPLRSQALPAERGGGVLPDVPADPLPSPAAVGAPDA